MGAARFLKNRFSRKVYLSFDRIEVTRKELKQAEIVGRHEAISKKYDVSRNKATKFENALQKRWERILISYVQANLASLRSHLDRVWDHLKFLPQAKEEFSRALAERNNLYSDSQLNPIVYFIIVFFIFAFEIPINVAVFATFGEGQFFTYLLAILLSILLGLVSHFLGAWIKASGIRFKYIILVTLIFGILGIISWARLRYFSDQEGGSTLLDYFKTEIDLNLIVTLFFLINSVLFLTGMCCSFLKHDSKPLLVKAYKRYNKLFKKVRANMSSMDSVWVNLNAVIGKCQSCFKEIRAQYISAYEDAGAPLPLCLRETINIDLKRVPGELENLIETAKEEYNKAKKAAEEALEPI